ncbi:MAG: hypothetical protein GF329_21345 [Candidatus Lokiarchaeota archaeon]|nr:hypothetical protein [Candidatus Lokiarchaeota archaeon]
MKKVFKGLRLNKFNNIKKNILLEKSALPPTLEGVGFLAEKICESIRRKY